MYYRGAEAALIVFDVTDMNSFEVMKDWVDGNIELDAVRVIESRIVECRWDECVTDVFSAELRTHAPNTGEK